MSIEKIMSKSVISVDMDDSLKIVKQKFDKYRFHHIVVIEQGKLFGVISDRDLLKNLSPKIGTLNQTDKDLATLNKKAHQILTRKPITLLPTASIRDAIEIFNCQNISCIPVVSKEGKPVGILSWRDILKAIEEKLKIAKPSL